MIIAKKDFLLAQEVSQLLDAEICSPKITIFPSGEMEICFDQSVTETVFLISELGTNINNSLIEILLIIDALKRSHAKNIILIATYLPYLRFDRIKASNMSYGSQFLAKLLDNGGLTKIVIIEPHFPQISGFFNIPVEIISTNSLFVSDIRERFDLDNSVLISPDIGGGKNVISIAESLNLKISCANKQRTKEGEILKLEFNDNIKGKHCIIVDDLIDTGKTIFTIASLLKEKQAKQISAYITHGIFSQNSLELLNSSSIDKLFITNSLKSFYNHPKIQEISLRRIIADYIKKFWNF